jgi:hypothetical protein
VHIGTFLDANIGNHLLLEVPQPTFMNGEHLLTEYV